MLLSKPNASSGFRNMKTVCIVLSTCSSYPASASSQYAIIPRLKNISLSASSFRLSSLSSKPFASIAYPLTHNLVDLSQTRYITIIMGTQLRSGKQVPSPKKPAKHRIVSIDDDYAPNSPERLYYPPADPTFRPGRVPSLSPTSSNPPKMKSGVTKPKAKKPRKPAAALTAALTQLGPNTPAGLMPEPVIRRRPSSIKSRSSSQASIKSSPRKKVYFDETNDAANIVSEDEGYDSPFAADFRKIRTSTKPNPPATPAVINKPRTFIPSTIKANPSSPKVKTPRESPTKAPLVNQIQPPKQAPINWDLMKSQSAALLSSLLTNPRGISLNDISACFYHLQIETRAWADSHFKFQLSDPEAIAAWPLHRLKTKYHPLLLTTQYIADGSQYGWRRFFTNGESRSCLVYGIVGEYVKQHVFGGTAFGFSREECGELEKVVDKGCLLFDGFVRNKLRAGMMKEMFYGKTAGERDEEMGKQVVDLVDGLLQVVEPLMPIEYFDYDLRRGEWGVKDDLTSRETMRVVREQLVRIVEMCVALHWGIRFRDEENVAVKIASHVQKGEQFHEMAPFVCLNEGMLEETRHHGVSGDGEGVRKIKMTCWGRVEAFLPRGKDIIELAEIETMYRATHGMLEKKAAKKEQEEDVDDDDEVEKHEIAEDGEEEVQKERDVKKEEKDDGFDWEKVDEWYSAYHKDTVRPDPPKEVKEHEMRENGKAKADDFRTPYVQRHHFMAFHDVYCEWEPADKPEFNFNTKVEGIKEEKPKSPRAKKRAEREADEKYGVPIPKSEGLSLRQAVEEARRERDVWKHRMEDSGIGMWRHLNNHWWKYESGAWLVIVLLFVKGSKGLSWKQMEEMSKARLMVLTRPAMRMAKFWGQMGKEAGQLFYIMVHKEFIEMLALAKKLRGWGWDEKVLGQKTTPKPSASAKAT